MLSAIFLFSLGLFSHAKNYDCTYKVTYQPLPKNEKFLNEIREGNAKAIKACKGKNPCPMKGSLRVTYTDSDSANLGHPSRKYEKNNISLERCSTAAQMACKITVKGTLFSKTVEATYKGEPLFKRICKHDGSSIEAILTMEPASATSRPAAKSTPKRKGSSK